MWSDFEREVMAQAIAEAKRGRPSPNPRVGAAIVRDGEIVALGHHAEVGHAHAEVDAIRNAGTDVEGTTLYVTLKPCNHQGRTGPCTEAILEATQHRTCPAPSTDSKPLVSTSTSGCWSRIAPRWSRTSPSTSKRVVLTSP